MIQNPAPRSSTHGRHSITTMRSLTSLLLVAVVVDLVVPAVVDVDAEADVEANVEDAALAKFQVGSLSHSDGISLMVSSGLSLPDLVEWLLRSGK